MKNNELSSTLDDNFYNKESYLSSIKEISAVDFDYQVEDDGIHITATAYTGSAVTPEYMFQVLQSDGSYTTIQDYSETDTVVLPVEDADNNITIRVTAKVKGNTIDNGRYCEKQITF